MDDQEWIDEDQECIPPHLQPPSHSDYLTIVDVTGVHFITVNYCHCPGSLPVHQQLLRGRLFPATLQRLSTAFTFHVLDDFIRDNLECGTSGSNYFSKLRRITSNVFPHLVPSLIRAKDRYRELLRVARKWRLLKLLKWNGFGHRSCTPQKGELALFCPACPQPGVNCNPSQNELSEPKYSQTFIMDGNFKAEHMHEKCPDNQIWLMDGHGYMVTRSEYQAYLKGTHHAHERSTCNNHQAVNQANTSQGKLESTGISGMACAQHGCFIPHSVVDFQKGECQVNMDYSFANAIQYNMSKITRIIHFYDINCTYMKKLRSRVKNSKFIDIPQDIQIVPGIGIWHVHGHRAECFSRHAPLFIPGAGWVDGEIIETLCQSLARKLRKANRSAATAATAFTDLDSTVSPEQRKMWESEERVAQETRITDPSAMDIFDVRLEKAPTIHAVELELLRSMPACDRTQGRMATWLARGLKIQEAQIGLGQEMRKIGWWPTDVQRLALARRVDCLSSDILAFVSEASVYLGHDPSDESSSGESDAEDDSIAEEILEDIGSQCPDQARIPIPSSLGLTRCKRLGLDRLWDQEIRLHAGQANDALHEIRLSLANKAVLFRTNVRLASSHAQTTHAWDKAMSHLGADDAMLSRYQPLRAEDLKVSTAAAMPNARGHRNDKLAWFWSMDIPKDTEGSDWMSEFYRVHWLRAKATKDRWREEVEILKAEFQWTINFFNKRAEDWTHLAVDSQTKGQHGAASYAARQSAMYGQLRDQCQISLESHHPARATRNISNAMPKFYTTEWIA
ncbi:hypothetical protein L210DRAFT_3507864 [Boletus edulis BED1]|uniref:CxC2-like cysteine cluster KDZ transposase-associated domain-containing protein n=1 Tax=Boletus edulis BED1 TaxID=1328754 RepID=A0AAD4BI01_BOLED|nr:hypothetical protein L210DRAFT_3507864 [Boletus edulis BED1]